MMAHKTHMKAQVAKPHKLAHATPYGYYGRTLDKAASNLHKVASHPGGATLRRRGVVKGPDFHGLKSWLERGGGHKASYKD
jgi:hypothetical protein